MDGFLHNTTGMYSSRASPPPSQAPPCVLTITFTFTSILATQIARLAGSLRRNNRIPGRVLVGGRLHRAARAATWPAGRADGSWSAPGECQAFISRRPLPPGHHGRPRAAPRRNFLQAGWNHGKNHVPRVAIAWKAVQRNSAATRERLHQVWGGLDAPMMNDRFGFVAALS